MWIGVLMVVFGVLMGEIWGFERSLEEEDPPNKVGEFPLCCVFHGD